jgi:3-deoxy-manno-octulosonate cytidylyltransferase (CMP-KDO synthetase)
VIPARYNSNRLAGKPLKKLKGKTLLEHSVNIARKMETASHIIVLTDDSRIYAQAMMLGVQVFLTPKYIINGTERLSHYLANIENQLRNDYRMYTLLQVDEPTLDPKELDRAVLYCHRSMYMETVTFCKTRDTYLPNNVYLKRGDDSYVNDFMRTDPGAPYHQHIGFYVYPYGHLADLTMADRTEKMLKRDIELLKSIEIGHPELEALEKTFDV